MDRVAGYIESGTKLGMYLIAFGDNLDLEQSI